MYMISVNDKFSCIANTGMVSFLHSEFKEVQISVKIKEYFSSHSSLWSPALKSVSFCICF